MSNSRTSFRHTGSAIPSMFIVTLNLARVIGSKVFHSEVEANSAMAEEAVKVAKRIARQRRRAVTLRVFSNVAALRVGRKEWVFNVLSAAHMPRVRQAWNMCTVQTVEPDGSFTSKCEPEE